MKSKDAAPVRLSEIVFNTDDFFDKEKMIKKLDRLILAWGKELVQKQYIDKIPDSDDAWRRFLDREIYWGDLKD